MRYGTLVALFCVVLVPSLVEAGRFKPGDELWTSRSFAGVKYHHSGVYVGKGQVVHVNARVADVVRRMSRGRTPVKIIKTSMAAFRRGKSVKRGPTRRRYSRKRVVKRALAQVNRAFIYVLPLNNCQHFSSGVVSGRRRSAEVDKFVRISKIVAKRSFRKVKRKVKHAFTGKDNVRIKLKNCTRRKVYVCVYNGGDRVRTIAKRVVTLRRKQTRTIRCASNGKGRCLVRLNTSKRCNLFHKVHNASRRRVHYLRKRRGKLYLSRRRCR